MNSRNHEYASFEDFEREELRRIESVGSSVDDMIDAIFGEQIQASSAASHSSPWDDDE